MLQASTFVLVGKHLNKVRQIQHKLKTLTGRNVKRVNTDMTTYILRRIRSIFVLSLFSISPKVQQVVICCNNPFCRCIRDEENQTINTRAKTNFPVTAVFHEKRLCLTRSKTSCTYERPIRWVSNSALVATRINHIH